ncbi:MAG TPA: dephospho-CoA kinase [Lachnospiraceae bacterium]|nr:dephospho-CoA kinase [Lachnospiraceae bacterium]
MKIIGVTGGVGAGKSTVLMYLAGQYRAKVIQADEIGHEVMEPGREAYQKILSVFGEGILSEDGSVDRKVLGGIVFADEEKLKALNAIIHPAVKEAILSRLTQAENAGEKYAVVEAALFLEEKYDAFCDETWYIYTNEERRRDRLKKSRGYTDERIDQIFANQKTHEEFLSRCEFVIDNNKAQEDTWRQIDRRMKSR